MKKKALVLAVYMACTSPTTATAKTLTSNFKDLNLGEVKSHSSLGEPFKGIIPILFTSRKQAKQLKIRLAPKSIFAKLGAEKSAELNYLKFKIKIRRNKPVIVVSSSRPINSPILNFILEIESAKGVIYQDYTVMLDPSTSKAKPKKTSHTTAVATKTKSKKTKHKTFSSTTRSRGSASTYRVKSGDTLSEIAKHYRHKGISLKKMQKSIHRANPRAFIHNDINKLKKGVVLDIPSKKQIKTSTKKKSKSTKKYQIGKTSKSHKQTKNLNTYKVKPGDSLSKITKKHLYEGVSFTKMMRAIFIANPKAFSKNKMTVLLSGAKLRIPTYVELVGEKARPATAKHINTLESITETKTSETKFSTQTQQIINSKTKTQTNNQVSLNKNTEAPFSKYSSNNPKTGNLVEAIEALENSNATISNLQKRIRELRGDLSTITVDYNDLTKVLYEDDFLLKIKENQGKKDIQALIKEYKKQRTLLAKTKTKAKIEIEEKISPKTIANNNSVFANKDLASISENSLSLTNLSYTILALLLGVILIRYRDRIYSYNSISYDNPKFYPSDQEIAQQSEEEKDLPSLTKILTGPLQSELSTPQNTHNIQDEFPWNKNNTEFLPKKILEKVSRQVEQQEGNSEISEESLQECDLLIDELILELAKKTSKEPKQENQLIDNIAKPENKNNADLEANHSISDMSNQFNIGTQKNNKTNLPIIDILSDADKSSSTSVATDKPQKI